MATIVAFMVMQLSYPSMTVSLQIEGQDQKQVVGGLMLL